MLLLDDEGTLYQPRRRIDSIQISSTNMNILPIHNLILYHTYLSNNLTIGLVIAIITIHQDSPLYQLNLGPLYFFLGFTPLNREALHITVIKTHQLIRFHASLSPTSISSPLIKAFDEHAKEVTIHRQPFTPGSTSDLSGLAWIGGGLQIHSR